VDDEDRENEGDLVMAAEKITPEAINFMLKVGRGVLCLSMTRERCETLNLSQQAVDNTTPFGTAFTVSVDAHTRFGVTTGVSANDRSKTIEVACAPDARPGDLCRPGHINPLMARDGGVLVRAGQTEGSVDLCRLAGMKPMGVIIEILNDDGSMARVPQLTAIAKEHGIRMFTVADIVEYRTKRETFVKRGVSTKLPTPYGEFTLIEYHSPVDAEPHLALCCGGVGDLDPNGQPFLHDEPVLVRVESECMTGHVFRSARCDCGDQLQASMQMVQRVGKGAVVYLRQEGRGIGLHNKLRAYKLQDEGLDTVEANLALGFKADPRDYGVGIQLLKDLGLTKVRLLTNNPKKTDAFVYGGFDLEVVDQVPIVPPIHEHNAEYLATKRDKMGHQLPKQGMTAEEMTNVADPPRRDQ
jgi:3,4-dihydroxy 2-butanone 4-phosphate synthase/GTP cyclohydrolase II